MKGGNIFDKMSIRESKPPFLFFLGQRRVVGWDGTAARMRIATLGDPCGVEIDQAMQR